MRRISEESSSPLCTPSKEMTPVNLADVVNPADVFVRGPGARRALRGETERARRHPSAVFRKKFECDWLS